MIGVGGLHQLLRAAPPPALFPRSLPGKQPTGPPGGLAGQPGPARNLVALDVLELLNPLDLSDLVDLVDPVDPVARPGLVDLGEGGGGLPSPSGVRAARRPARFVKNFLWAWADHVDD